MISRRQIIASGQPADSRQQEAVSSSSASSSNASKPSSRTSNKLAGKQTLGQQQTKSSKMSQAVVSKMAPTTNGKKHHEQQDSEDYALNSAAHPYEDFLEPPLDERAQWRAQQRAKNNQPQEPASEQLEPNYRHFDPYSIYSDEEDVWYSEERLFEDHLEEIYNKWPLLDDDIWCKLIIMERNRRIGKAYARVPIVTIDGSHELSYDGYKLALNGFDNPDRDDETDECRKRLGKGIRIKMDNFGNILIKRLSKAGVHVKEWVSPPKAPVSGGSSNSTNGSSGAGVGRSLMPSRQQLIKAASMGGQLGAPHGQQASAISSAGSSMESQANDSAICDEILHLGGHLSLEQIYVLFDMKRFQANISQELCRPLPDRRKLEQQCFSIVGLARDSEDILNLPCWVMVINIVAIEMLNERFPLAAHAGLSDFADARRLGAQAAHAPSFVSIFDQAKGGLAKHAAGADKSNGKEEDPYSMPANASSSDVKSSINDYGTASTKNISNYIESALPNYSARYSRNPQFQQQHQPSRPRQHELLMARNRSKSNYNIYGQANNSGLLAAGRPTRYTERYNNSSSIYSPGHMLVQTDQPPKLPPRDFLAKRPVKSKSSSNVNSMAEQLADSMQPVSSLQTKQDESIYSTRAELKAAQENEEATQGAKAARKTKKNRFLESLRAPLEMAKSGRSASVMGAPTSAPAERTQVEQTKQKTTAKAKGGLSKARNLRSFLGVGVKSSAASAKDSASDDSAYVQLEPASSKSALDSAEADSAVDPNEELDDSQQLATSNSSGGSPAASYNDLDIPTPDYETDENIYALEQANSASAYHKSAANLASNTLKQPAAGSAGRTRRSSNKGTGASQRDLRAPKDDLYYSGFMAHVPHAIQAGDSQLAKPTRRSRARAPDPPAGGCDDRMSCVEGAGHSRYLMRTSRMLAAKMGAREIYGSTLGLQQQARDTQAGLRHRSSSMQRYYPAATMRSATGHPLPPASMAARDYDYPPHFQQHAQRRLRSNRSQNELAYNPNEFESPYAMSAGPYESHYGVSTAASCIVSSSNGGAAASRRRSVSSKLLPMAARSLAPSLMNGLYGQHNSGSSSSDYADWQPRKPTSSGYLNSIFKSHKLVHSSNGSSSGAPQAAHPVDLSSSSNNNNNNNNNNNEAAANSRTAKSSKGSAKMRNNYGVARALKTSQQQQQQALCDQQSADLADVCRQQQQQHSESLDRQPAYRSYDSSNDSDPSYTNSSDGLDIYDQIGAHSRSHLAHHHNQFLEHQLAQEVHVGEWENLYDR